VANLCSRAAFSSDLDMPDAGDFRLASENGLWHQPPRLKGQFPLISGPMLQ
jgi:hypothetical protein